MTQMTLYFFFFFLSLALAAKTQAPPFQKNIETCLQAQVDTSKIDTLMDLYLALDKAFSLRTTEVIFREVVFKKDAENRKLKLSKGKILLYKIQDDKTLKLINNDARQKGLTEDSSINQLLIGAEVRSDWLKVRETRSDQTQLEYGKQQGKLTSLTFQQPNQPKRLVCSHISLSDICLCRL